MGQTFLRSPKLIEINTIKVHQHKAPASKRILNTFLRRVGGEKLVKNHVKNKKQEGKLKSKPSILIKKHVEHAIVLLLEVRSLGAFHRPAR